MLQGILIIVVFLVIAALMMTKKIPTLLALPLMAVIICIIAGVPAVGTDAEGNAIGWLQTVVENGTVRMGSAIMAVIFGAWLGQLMNKTGVTENIIKKSAELGGDRPLVVTLIMVVAVAILFTTLSGLGSIIMVGSIVLPILVSVGVPAISAACIFLMAFTTGLTFNIANWKSFSSIFGLEIEQIKSFEIYLLIATLIATLVLVFCGIQEKRCEICLLRHREAMFRRPASSRVLPVRWPCSLRWFPSCWSLCLRCLLCRHSSQASFGCLCLHPRAFPRR